MYRARQRLGDALVQLGDEYEEAREEPEAGIRDRRLQRSHDAFNGRSQR